MVQSDGKRIAFAFVGHVWQSKDVFAAAVNSGAQFSDWNLEAGKKRKMNCPDRPFRFDRREFHQAASKSLSVFWPAETIGYFRSARCVLKFHANQTRIHADRIAGGHCHHCDSGGVAAARIVADRKSTRL